MREFRDRRDAGERLAARLASYADESPVVVGLPRGGVVVAAAVAEALRAPLDVIVVRKLGVPSQPELGMGAVGEGGVIVRTEPVIQAARVTPQQFDAVVVREREEVVHRAKRFRGRPRADIARRADGDRGRRRDRDGWHRARGARSGPRARGSARRAGGAGRAARHAACAAVGGRRRRVSRRPPVVPSRRDALSRFHADFGPGRDCVAPVPSRTGWRLTRRFATK